MRCVIQSSPWSHPYLRTSNMMHLANILFLGMGAIAHQSFKTADADE